MTTTPNNDIEVVELTREEFLEAENIELKIRLADIELQRLISSRRNVVEAIKERTGIDIGSQEWTIDLPHGVARKVK